MSVPDLMQAAAASRQAKDFRAAVELYRRVLVLEPNQATALRGLADAYRGMGEHRACLDAWERYLVLEPQDGSVRARMGDACRRLGLGSRALSEYKAALRHDPKDRHALLGLGELHEAEHRPEEALACWEKVLELDPELILIRTAAGNLCRRKLDFSRAEHHFREALRLDPHHHHAIFGLADALRGQGRFREAAPYWEAILEAEPGNRQVLCRAGDCFARLWNLDRAETLFRTAMHRGFDRPALLGLARVQTLRGAPTEASRCYEALLARNPADARASQLLAQARSGAQR